MTPAVRPGSSMATAQPTSKRPRLGESTAAHNNAPAHGASQTYLGSSRGPGAHRPGSPSKIPSKTASVASSLPRPVPLAMPVPKPGTAHHALGHGRVPSAQAATHSYGLAQSQVRAVSAASAGSYRGQYAYGAPPLPPNAGVLAKKASRARRESFKPRPSMENDWAVGGRRYAGFAGAVKEEDEDY